MKISKLLWSAKALRLGLLGFIGMVMLSGCSYRLGDFNVISNQNMNLDSGTFVQG